MLAVEEKSADKIQEPVTPQGQAPSTAELADDPPQPDLLLQRLVKYAAQAYAGPMPPPELLRAYAEISPELPNRMMAMAEKAQEHVHARDMAELAAIREDMQKNWSVVRWGQFFGFGIGIAALVAGVVCLKIAPNAAGASMGTILGGGGIATLIWAFRYDRSAERDATEARMDHTSRSSDFPPVSAGEAEGFPNSEQALP